MNLFKSMVNTVGGFGGIAIGIIGLVFGIKTNTLAEYICGGPALIAGIIMLIRAYKYINIDFE